MWWTFLMRRKNPRGCHLWGFLVRYGEPLRIGCCCLFISVQPFAYVVANYTCYNRDKKCGEQFCHGRTPPFWWRFGSVYSISHFILIFYNFLLMKTMINIKKEAVWKFHTASWPVRESNPGLRRERASSWPLDQQAIFNFIQSRRRDSNTRPLRPELYWLKCTKNPQEFSSTLKPCIYKVFTYHITSISIRHIEVNKINVRNLLENYV